MRQGVVRRVVLLITCAFFSGCLLNSVHSITTAPPAKSDAAHAIVVIGVGLDVAWPFSEFPVVLDEYSAEKQGITGTCFHYNRVEITRPSNPAKIAYFAYEFRRTFTCTAGATQTPSSCRHLRGAPS
jgi:hypothetical protein